MLLSELCAILKGYIADDDSVENYEIRHANFGAINPSAIVVDDGTKRIVFDTDHGESNSVACLLEYEEEYADYEVCHMEFGALIGSNRAEVDDKKKIIIIC